MLPAKSTTSVHPAHVFAALKAAVRAPSPHNTQPWMFTVASNHIDVLLDAHRILKVCDPEGREARLACGAALLNIQLALAAAGRSYSVEILPDRNSPELIARVRFRGLHHTTDDDVRLSAAITRRCSNRRPFLDQSVSAAERYRLTQAAALEGTRLLLLEQPGQLDEFAVLLRRADFLQTERPAFRDELLAWTSFSSQRRDDGVPQWAGGPHPTTGSLLALRQYGTKESIVERSYEQSPLVAVLITDDDNYFSQIRAGQAMQRVLLTATSRGLSASFLSQPIEINETRSALRTALGTGGMPQAAFRIGYGYPGAATPRRPIAAVTQMA